MSLNASCRAKPTMIDTIPSPATIDVTLIPYICKTNIKSNIITT